MVDLLVTAVILLLLFLSPYLLLQDKKGTGQKELIVYRDSKVISTTGLNDKDELISIDGLNLEIKGGRVRVLHSDCPKGLCRHFGWISGPGQTIVCVPKRILVEIEGKKEEQAYQVLSY